jgi:nicotinamidase-related amidase
MLTLDRARSALLLIDFQARLMPAIDQGDAALGQAARLIEAATILEVPMLATEQNPRGLGPTVEGLARPGLPAFEKMSFDASRTRGFFEALPAERPDLVVVGCEAHVCVLQTVLGLIAAGRRVFVVEDAVGSRRPASKAAALERMARHGAEIVTAEMVIFEWLGTAEHPRFKEVIALVK